MPGSIRSAATVTAALMTVALAVSACSDDTAADNEADACGAIASFRAAVNQIDTLSATSSLEEFREVRDEVKEAHKDLISKLEDVADDRAGQLDAAYDDFRDSADDLDDDESIAAALTALQSDADKIRTAERAVAADLACD